MSTDLVPTLDLDALRDRVDTVLAEYLRQAPAGVPSRSRAGELTRALTDFVLAPGKRIRPLLCLLGWHAAGGGEDEESLWRMAASLEVFHASALIHDDIIDNSPTRRGRPSAHRVFAARQRARPDADAFGIHAALLLGDLALICSDALMNSARLSTRQRQTVLPLLDAMRGEVLLGQHLDLLATGRPTGDIDEAMAIARLKTAKYTIERPLHLGAALAGADQGLLDLCSAYALPLGEAFQLRDDLLGVFGDPALTGKPVLEDLRSGKATVLMAVATRRATPEQRRTLDALVGRADIVEEDCARVRRILRRTGARDTVESMIAERYERTLAALETDLLAPPVTAALRQIAHRAAIRTA
ncbi:polyprenyl synthetase family protein [Streptomyces sp. enrichment culture]|uniref:polyprenyl synthetase family protein n=1 Tax=Streptomyces sp. enrichment culture TaxID=1795815 RepID=UPI003F56B655